MTDKPRASHSIGATDQPTMMRPRHWSAPPAACATSAPAGQYLDELDGQLSADVC